jgi:hypothetical protein
MAVISLWVMALCGSRTYAAPFTVANGLFDQTKLENLGLQRAPGAETYTVYKPSASMNKYSNGVVVIGFRGALYCQWQSSAVHEDSTDTWVAYSKSIDGKNWSAPMVLAEARNDGHPTSGGWWVSGDSLIAYINFWPDGLSPRGGQVFYKTSKDGFTWSEQKPVLMNDGSPMAGVFEQDPHALPGGRIINAAHFQPGLIVNPIYTDDPSGVRGWKKSNYTNLSVSTNSSQEMEPSWFHQSNEKVVMVFRDQNSSFRKIASLSSDHGQTWSLPEITEMPDSRAKQSAGNLPDGTAYMVGNPREDKTRFPLVLTLSSDGLEFDKAYVLRGGESDLQAQQYTGKAKTIGYSYPKSVVIGDYLYVAYATNKEDVEITRIPLAEISQNGKVHLHSVVLSHHKNPEDRFPRNVKGQRIQGDFMNHKIWQIHVLP